MYVTHSGRSRETIVPFPTASNTGLVIKKVLAKEAFRKEGGI